MVVRCVQADAGGFRLWPVFSAAALRRKVLEVLTCGGGGEGGPGSCRGNSAYRSPQRMPRPRPRSERLAELLRAEPSECGDDVVEAEADAARKAEALEELKGVVGALQVGGGGDDADGCMSRVEAAMAVRRKAKDDAAAREMLAMLGAIPPLVAMLDDGDGAEEVMVAALYALLNLGIGNDTNKAAVVKAGAVHKMLHIAEAASGALTEEAVVANFLCLSALDANKPVIGASGAAPFLVRAFEGASSTEQARHDALRALLNLSIAPANAPHLLAAGLAPALVAAVGGDTDTTSATADRALAALCNLVAASAEGCRAVSRAPDAVPVLVDVLNWSDEPGCQEKAAYVLMVLAHRSYGDRAAMVEAGAASTLLELTLVGTALAQKRASRILEILRADKGKQVADVVAAVSAPQERGCREGEDAAGEGEPGDAGMSVEKRAVWQLVQQSLHSNMRRIVRRARLPQDLAPASSESLKALTSSSTSKSLPF